MTGGKSSSNSRLTGSTHETRMAWRMENTSDGPVVYLYDDIVQTSYEDWDGNKYGVSAEDIVEFLNQNKGKEVTCRINSNGGNAFVGVAMYEALKAHDGGCKTIVDGIAASAASVVMLAGQSRLISRGGTVMVHEPSVLAYGNRAEIRSLLESLDSLTESVVSLYVERTSAKKEDVETWLSATKYFSSREAVEHGFATGYIGEEAKSTPAMKKTEEPAKPDVPDLALRVRQAQLAMRKRRTPAAP
jgi:ATP-dependent protease ClpP protease subunit